MKRAETIERLIKEGFSEKTLVKFNDSQLKKFADKILKEAQTVTTTKTVYNSKDPKDVSALNTALKDPKVNKNDIEVKEDAKGLGVKKNVKKKGKSILNLRDADAFVESVVNKQYHSITKKSEILEMIKSKMSTSSEDLSEKRLPKLPEFLSFDSIMSSAKPEEAPAQPEVIPDAPPKETPSREDNPRKRPFRRPNEEPVVEPDPKAKIKKIRRPMMSMAAE